MGFEMNKFNKIPIPICGVFLALVSLGNLLGETNITVKYLLGTTGVILVLSLFIQTLNDMEDFKNDLDSPILLGTFGTLSMGLMAFSTYFLNYNKNMALIIWLIGLIIHILIIIIFTKRYIIHGKLEDLTTSSFIVYIGIGIAAMTGFKFDQFNFINYGTFIFGLLSFIILFFIVSYRYIKLPIPDSTKPLLCIYTAPASIILVEYFRLNIPKSVNLIIFAYIIACILYLFAFINLIRCLKLPFYPSYAGFTFPFVISATATTLVNQYFINLGTKIYMLDILDNIEITIAICIVLYVLVRYLLYIFNIKIEIKKKIKKNNQMPTTN